MAAMLAAPRKRTGNLDFGGALNTWLHANTGPHVHGSSGASSTVLEAGRLRDFAANPVGSIEEVQAKLIRYCQFLAALEAALPIGPERRGVPISFSWTDAFTEQRADRAAVAFEKSAVLFNLASWLAGDAAAADVGADAGCKRAARRFQEAAGIFQHLAANVPLRMDFQGLTDLSPDATSAMAAICLAQAQEVTYLKAAVDGKSPALLGRIARQASAMYNDAAARLQPDSTPLAKALGRPMGAHLAAKAALAGGLAWRHQAAAAAAEDQCGTQIACLQEAAKHLEAAKRAAGSAKVDAALPASIQREASAVAAALAAARRDNDTVYLQRIPPGDSVPRADGAALVKAAAVPEGLETVDDAWFAFLRIPAPALPERKSGGGLIGAIGRILNG